MLQSYEEAKEHLKTGDPVLGWGWREVQAFEDMDDLEDYESEEEEIYVVVDLGTGVDNKAMLAENSYQLIGLDTPLPFLKLGNQIYQGEVSPLIGDEIIFGRIRNENNPHLNTRPPWHVTSNRLAFRPIDLKPKEDAPPSPLLPKAQRKKKDFAPFSLEERDDLVTVTMAHTSTPTPAPDSPEPINSVVAGPSTSGRDVEQPLAGPSGSTSPDKARAEVAVGDSVPQAGPSEGEPSNSTTQTAKKPVKKSVPTQRLLKSVEEVMASTAMSIANHIRFRLTPELTDRLAPQTTAEHAARINKSGYSQKDLIKMLAGLPLRGKGSRVPAPGDESDASDLGTEVTPSEGAGVSERGDFGDSISTAKGRGKGKATRGRKAGSSEGSGRGRGRGRGGSGRGRGRGRGGKAASGSVEPDPIAEEGEAGDGNPAAVVETSTIENIAEEDEAGNNKSREVEGDGDVSMA